MHIILDRFKPEASAFAIKRGGEAKEEMGKGEGKGEGKGTRRKGAKREMLNAFFSSF